MSLGAPRPTREGCPNRAVEFKRRLAVAACQLRTSVAKLAPGHSLDTTADEMPSLPSAMTLRKLPAHAFRVQLVAVYASGERSLGEYTLARTPD